LPNQFEGQVAIVTGGGTGLGKAMALNLARNGAKVVIASRKLENLNPAKEEIAKVTKAEQVIACQTDVRDPEQVQNLINQTKEKFGRIDILINNAAGNFAVPSEKLTPNGWKAVVEIVLNGTWFCSSIAGQEMIKQGSGCILNIIATYAWTGAPGVVHSASAKAGVLAMTRTLAAEWGHYGIRVNAFAPGAMVTEAASKNLLFDTEKAQEQVRKKIPLGRVTSVEEMAELAAFLCSPKAAFITGDVMTADGGNWLGRGFMDLMEHASG
jgi:NAD(P)-dependent dehydrogenase (short-subunit alcohol dehydrogenase family)